jgi:hypothetical protein
MQFSATGRGILSVPNRAGACRSKTAIHIGFITLAVMSASLAIRCMCESNKATHQE